MVIAHGLSIAEPNDGGIIHRTKDNLVIKTLQGDEARPYLEQIATLRIHMFKEFPYLYEGSLVYEKDYLETYFKSKNSVILLVFDGDKVVGFSNSIPMTDETKEIQKPLRDKGLDPQHYLYIGEVMIQPPYRGKGLLRQFFDYHELRAKKERYSHLVFMTVDRPKTHPLRPMDYRILEPIWTHFGYSVLEGAYVNLSWKQVDTHKDEKNTLTLWMKKVEA
ncbi:MAG: GNAT family N-acetyltransferase [Alphaproteobacteria bacterium]|nr:GNAT family N-acetyltransferase [Alphaproteobacteria bacterium]